MTGKIRDTYSEFVSDNCSETGDGGKHCSVVLPSLSFYVVCAESVRDKMYGTACPIKMCDCMILDHSEDKISLVELKSGMSRSRSLKFFKNCKHQLNGGLCMLVEILQSVGKLQVDLQAVLFSNIEFRDPSVQREFMKPFKHIKIRPVRVQCGCKLPDNYEHVTIPIIDSTSV